MRVIQTLLGHGVRTTQIYTSVSTQAVRAVLSPLDSLAAAVNEAEQL